MSLDTRRRPSWCICGPSIGDHAGCLHFGMRLRRRAPKPESAIPRGSEHWKSKITEAQVRTMRRKRRAGVSVLDLARAYGLSSGAASKIVNKKTWRHA